MEMLTGVMWCHIVGPLMIPTPICHSVVMRFCQTVPLCGCWWTVCAVPGIEALDGSHLPSHDVSISSLNCLLPVSVVSLLSMKAVLKNKFNIISFWLLQISMLVHSKSQYARCVDFKFDLLCRSSTHFSNDISLYLKQYLLANFND